MSTQRMPDEMTYYPPVCKNCEGIQPESCLFCGADMETVKCEGCERTIKLGEARSVEDFWMCAGCLAKEAS